MKAPSTLQPVPASCGCQLWVTGLAGLHFLVGLNKSVKFYMSPVTTGHFPKMRCPQTSYPSVCPSHQLTTGSQGTFVSFPQDSSPFTYPHSVLQKAFQHISFSFHTSPLCQNFLLGLNVPHHWFKGLPPPQLAPSTLTLEPWFSAPFCLKQKIIFVVFCLKPKFSRKPQMSNGKPELCWPNHEMLPRNLPRQFMLYLPWRIIGWVAKGTPENPLGLGNANEQHQSKPDIVSCQTASPLFSTPFFSRCPLFLFRHFPDLSPFCCSCCPFHSSQHCAMLLNQRWDSPLRRIWKYGRCFGCANAWGGTLLAFTGQWLGPRDSKHTPILTTLQNKELSWKQWPCWETLL